MIPAFDIDNLPFRISFMTGNCVVFKWDETKCIVISDSTDVIHSMEIWEISISAIENTRVYII